VKDQKDIISNINDGDYKTVLYNHHHEIEVRIKEKTTKRLNLEF